MFGAVLPQLIWEYQNQKEWLAGNFLCKFVKFVQSFSMMTSTNILVAMALDRYHVIRKPLKRPYSVLKIIAAAWLIAGVTSMPMLFVFHTETINNVTKCENIFRDKPKSHRQAFLTYICMIVFVFPVIILAFSYIGIFVTILRKAKERKQRHNTVDKLKENNFLRQNTYPTTFLKARTKTLKMTCVIVTMYIFCTLPYFVAEMIMSYGDHCSISRVLYGIFGVLVAANSTANPSVYLAFNVKIKHARKHTYSVNLARFDQNQTSVVSF
ncbi:cephalotocin receptor 2-like [Saccostrea cucullata]|uniref:cephalotocin receptor 2-like n=1 Tax=Saccostrea cuccullata TaxID=36930 RepID=UPI002ED4AA5B